MTRYDLWRLTAHRVNAWKRHRVYRSGRHELALAVLGSFLWLIVFVCLLVLYGDKPGWLA